MATEDTVKRTLDAFNRHDAAAFAAQYAPDAVVYDPMYPQPLKGRDAIRKDVEDFFTAFPDIQFKVSSIMAKGDTGALEGQGTGTHTGPIAGPAGTIPGTNRRIEMPAAFFVRINDRGLLIEERRYMDMAGMMQQLGLMPGS